MGRSIGAGAVVGPLGTDTHPAPTPRRRNNACGDCSLRVTYRQAEGTAEVDVRRALARVHAILFAPATTTPTPHADPCSETGEGPATNGAPREKTETQPCPQQSSGTIVAHPG